MAEGQFNLINTGRRLIDSDGKQVIACSGDDKCCGCWRVATPCSCNPNEPNEYIECTIATTLLDNLGDFAFKNNSLKCFELKSTSTTVTTLPPGITEFVPVNIVADCDECCPPVTQACCFPDGHCEELLETTCIAQGGIPQGPNTVCPGTVCDVQNIDCPHDSLCPSTVLAMGQLGDPICQPFGPYPDRFIFPTDFQATLQRVTPLNWRANVEGFGGQPATGQILNNDFGNVCPGVPGNIGPPILQILLSCFSGFTPPGWSLSIIFNVILVDRDDQSCTTGAFDQGQVTYFAQNFSFENCLVMDTFSITSCMDSSPGNFWGSPQLFPCSCTGFTANVI